MSETPSRLADRAGELRQAFDRAFTEAARPAAVQTDDLLALRVGPDPYALRLSEIAGLYADRAVTRVPGGAAALLGFAGFRGAIAPVYDLHLLLGQASAKAPRWLVMAQAVPVALAFEAFEGHLRVPREAILGQAIRAQGPGQTSHPLIRGFASTDGLARPIVHLPSVLDAIRTAPPRSNVRMEG